MKRKEFVFSNRHQDILPLLLDAVTFIELELPIQADKLVPKMKLALIELATNSIKHSGNNEAGFIIDLKDSLLQINKIDYGLPFFLKDTEKHPGLAWPVDESMINQKIEIYSDGLNGLFAMIIDGCQIKFITEEYPAEFVSKSSISEHYGLMIISKLATDFCYQHNLSSGANTFVIDIAF